MLTLKDVLPGQSAIVLSVKGNGPLRRRVLDMGMTRGTEILVRKVAPLGDPIELTIRGYELTIRKDDAQIVEIERK